MEIDWTLLILLAVGALFVLGLVLALGTSAGKKRLGESALALAEALLRYAIGWLESSLPKTEGAVVDAPPNLIRACQALDVLQGRWESQKRNG